jgi:hypothetical protein
VDVVEEAVERPEPEELLLCGGLIEVVEVDLFLPK